MEKKKLTRKDFDRMWGDTGPYSEVSLSEQVRILDDSISRVFLVVEAKINPFTFEMTLKHREHFRDDEPTQQLLDHAEFRAVDGYIVSAGEEPLIDERSYEIVEQYRKRTVECIIKMHRFILEKYGLPGSSAAKIRLADPTEPENRKYIWDNQKGIVDSGSVWESYSDVTSPAGSKNGKFRYYVVFAINGRKILSRDQIAYSAKQMHSIADKMRVSVENAEANSGYIMLTALIPPDAAPADFVESSIAASNANENLFHSNYFITNVSRPTENEIQPWLKTLKRARSNSTKK